MSRVVVAAVAALAAAAYIFIYTTERADLPIRADGFSYYVYLPAWFIHHDTSLATTARDCCGGEFPAYTFMTRWPGTRRWVNRTTLASRLTPFLLLTVIPNAAWWGISTLFTVTL